MIHVCDRHPGVVGSKGYKGLSCEGSIAVPEQNRDVPVVGVSGDQVEFMVAIQVGDGDIAVSTTAPVTDGIDRGSGEIAGTIAKENVNLGRVGAHLHGHVQIPVMIEVAQS